MYFLRLLADGRKLRQKRRYYLKPLTADSDAQDGENPLITADYALWLEHRSGTAGPDD